LLLNVVVVVDVNETVDLLLLLIQVVNVSRRLLW